LRSHSSSLRQKQGERHNEGISYKIISKQHFSTELSKNGHFSIIARFFELSESFGTFFEALPLINIFNENFNCIARIVNQTIDSLFFFQDVSLRLKSNILLTTS
jgi:hypothetical protein